MSFLLIYGVSLLLNLLIADWGSVGLFIYLFIFSEWHFNLILSGHARIIVQRMIFSRSLHFQWSWFLLQSVVFEISVCVCMCFLSVTRTWSEPEMKGAVPIPRDSHSCTTVGDRLFVFGGTDGRNPLRDLLILDTSKLSCIWILCVTYWICSRYIQLYQLAPLMCEPVSF